MGQKKRFALMVDRDVLERLESIKARTGLSYAEQIRRAIRKWLNSREWTVRRSANRAPPGG